MKKVIFIIILIFIYGRFMLNNNIFKRNNTDDLVIKDNTVYCNNIEEIIYEDDNYIYYFECEKSKNISIIIKGKEYTLPDTLKNNIVSIDTLINNGLDIKKKLKNIDIVEDSNLIFNLEQINLYNKKIKDKTNKIYDMNILSITKEEIYNYINSYQIEFPKYNGREKLTIENTKDIFNNRNLDNIQDLENIPKGIIINRANLRSFPSDKCIYDKLNVTIHDKMQETELLVNTPVLILHESKDKLWNFVITPYYVGWVKKENIALTTDDTYNYFINPNNFGIITANHIIVNDIVLDMSVKLPSIGNNEYILPIKDKNGYIAKKVVYIDSTDINNGYLPYSIDNIILQAKKYLNEPYSFGGKNGIDCSSYIGNIFRTFGLYFPRNTADQKDSVGEIINLEGKSNQEKLNIISEHMPGLLYKDGHVMLYIGTNDNIHYIIHANGKDMKVAITKLDNSTYLKEINRIVLIDSLNF